MKPAALILFHRRSISIPSTLPLFDFIMSMPRSNKRKASATQPAQRASNRIKASRNATNPTAASVDKVQIVGGDKVQPYHEVATNVGQSSAAAEISTPTPAAGQPLPPPVFYGTIDQAVASAEAVTWTVTRKSDKGPTTSKVTLKISTSPAPISSSTPTQPQFNFSKLTKPVKNRSVRPLPERRSSARIAGLNEGSVRKNSEAAAWPSVTKDKKSTLISALSTSTIVNTDAEERNTSVDDTSKVDNPAVPDAIEVTSDAATPTHEHDANDYQHYYPTFYPTQDNEDETDDESLSRHSSFLPVSSVRDEPRVGSTLVDLVDAAARANNWDVMQQAVACVTATKWDNFLQVAALEKAALDHTERLDTLFQAVEIVNSRALDVQVEAEVPASEAEQSTDTECIDREEAEVRDILHVSE